MSLLDTTIQKPEKPKSPKVPTLNKYETPDLATNASSTIDTSKTGYTSPVKKYDGYSLDQGLLNYDASNSKKHTFDGREINSSDLGADIKTETPKFGKSNQFLTDGAFVEKRVNGLLDPNNPLMKRARALGRQQAAARGLHNTTMGASMGNALMADKAIQIASQDATTQATADMNLQKATYQAQGRTHEGQIKGNLAQQAAEINSALAAQRAGQAWDMVDKKAAAQADLNKQQANITAAQMEHKGLIEGAGRQQQANITAELAGLETRNKQNLALFQDKLNAAANTTKEQNAAIMQSYQHQQDIIKTTLVKEYDRVINQANINAGMKKALANEMQQMAHNFEISAQNIMLNPDLTAEGKNAALARLNRMYNQDMANIAKIFGASYKGNTGASGGDLIQSHADIAAKERKKKAANSSSGSSNASSSTSSTSSPPGGAGHRANHKTNHGANHGRTKPLGPNGRSTGANLHMVDSLMKKKAAYIYNYKHDWSAAQKRRAMKNYARGLRQKYGASPTYQYHPYRKP